MSAVSEHAGMDFRSQRRDECGRFGIVSEPGDRKIVEVSETGGLRRSSVVLPGTGRSSDTWIP